MSVEQLPAWISLGNTVLNNKIVSEEATAKEIQKTIRNDINDICNRTLKEIVADLHNNHKKDKDVLLNQYRIICYLCHLAVKKKDFMKALMNNECDILLNKTMHKKLYLIRSYYKNEHDDQYKQFDYYDKCFLEKTQESLGYPKLIDTKWSTFKHELNDLGFSTIRTKLIKKTGEYNIEDECFCSFDTSSYVNEEALIIILDKIKMIYCTSTLYTKQYLKGKSNITPSKVTGKSRRELDITINQKIREAKEARIAVLLTKQGKLIEEFLKGYYNLGDL